MLLLSFAWLVLVLLELTGYESHALEVFGTSIWLIFSAEFVLRFVIAPSKIAFLKNNWLTVIALVVPALRLFRGIAILRPARALRCVRLVKVVGSANRGMKALAASFERRGVGYAIATTIVVALLGAGGMLAFEPADKVAGGFESYGDALWWTSMLLTTIGSQFWPQTAEGRLLCFLLSLYGLAVFGYITASLASFFVGRDAARSGDSLPEISALRGEIAALRRQMQRERDERQA